jgi:hypothetical protein
MFKKGKCSIIPFSSVAHGIDLDGGVLPLCILDNTGADVRKETIVRLGLGALFVGFLAIFPAHAMTFSLSQSNLARNP